MSSRGFSELEIDAIGEILNISLGASATAVSTMLSARVDITTPVVKVVSRDEFEFTNLEPAVGVEITYVSGLEGDNIMLLKRQDVKVIVEMLMGMDIPDDEFVLDEMNISAICEVMNQMMGASATALSEFLNKSVNISTPISFEITDEGEFKNKYFPEDKEEMVVVGFSLKIADKLQSEFINVMPTELAKGMVAGFLPDGDDGELQVTPDPPKEPTGDKMLSQEEIAAMIAASNNDPPAAPTPVEPSGDKMMSQEEIAAMIAASSGETPAAPTPAEPSSDKMMSQEEIAAMIAASSGEATPTPTPPVAPIITPAAPAAPVIDSVSAEAVQNQLAIQQQMMQQMQMMMQQMQSTPQPKSEPRTFNVRSMPQPNLNQEGGGEGEEENMELILGVPLDISVEIGRTKKLVKDILEFSKGSLVVLDKAAGEQVDLFVNGQCIAKGDVVVVEDNFGIRITEIVKKNVVTE